MARGGAEIRQSEGAGDLRNRMRAIVRTRDQTDTSDGVRPDACAMEEIRKGLRKDFNEEL